MKSITNSRYLQVDASKVGGGPGGAAATSEGVLANFFNSLLSKKTGGAAGGAPGGPGGSPGGGGGGGVGSMGPNGQIMVSSPGGVAAGSPGGVSGGGGDGECELKYVQSGAACPSLGFEDENFWSSPGWWAPTVASYCPSRPRKLPKFLSSKPCERSAAPPCI